ncbi:MAG: hypothetical protein IKT56_00685 [Clostridia bacterium]|nr:hypothetical protein [Clostridia bacterium]
MKKILCILLTIIMLIGLCSCSYTLLPSDVRGSVNIPGDDKDTTNVPVDVQNTLDTSDDVQDTTDNSAEDTESLDFSMGTSSSGVYTNDFLGLSFTAPEGWVFYTDKQILELNNVVSEFYDEDTLEALKNATIVYDMYATYEDGMQSVNINMEKLSSFEIMSFDVKESLESQIGALKTSYENMGYTDVDVKYQKITVDGKEFDALTLSANLYGYSASVVVFSFIRGNYMANVAAFSFYSGGVEEILKCFTVK